MYMCLHASLHACVSVSILVCVWGCMSVRVSAVLQSILETVVWSYLALEDWHRLVFDQWFPLSETPAVICLAWHHPDKLNTIYTSSWSAVTAWMNWRLCGHLRGRNSQHYGALLLLQKRWITGYFFATLPKTWLWLEGGNVFYLLSS